MELAKKIINIMELNGIKSGSNFIKTKNRNVWLRKISPGTLKPQKNTSQAMRPVRCFLFSRSFVYKIFNTRTCSTSSESELKVRAGISIEYRGHIMFIRSMSREMEHHIKLKLLFVTLQVFLQRMNYIF